MSWVPRKGKAQKIAAGADGSIWRLSASAVDGGGKQIYKWSGDNWKQVGTKGFLTMDIDPNGVPWAVNNQKKLYKLSGK